MKKSNETSKTKTEMDFEENVMDILKEAAACGLMTKLKNEPVKEEILNFGHCNVSLEVDQVIKSPVFFIENDDVDKNVFALEIPTPSDVALNYYNISKESKAMLNKPKPKYTTNGAFNDIILNEFFKVVEMNVYNIFINGLYSFIHPFLNITQDQAASILHYEVSDTEKHIIKGRLLLSSKNGNEDGTVIMEISTIMATIIGNMYFDFINTIMLHGFINMGEFIKYLADIQDIPFGNISPKQYYMFAQGCLLEIATEDVHKDLEIVEANTAHMCYKYHEEFNSGIELKQRI